MRNDIERSRVERSAGREIFSLGPAGVGGQSAAAEIDATGNLVECARFDDEGCSGGFDVAAFCE